MSGPTLCGHCGAEYVDGRCPHEPQPSDSERLDWLDIGRYPSRTWMGVWTVRNAAGRCLGEGRSLREAIDAAMEAERNG